MSIEIISEKKTQIGQVTVTFTFGRIVSQAKATEGKAGMAVGTPHVRLTTAGTGLRVGEASADLPTTSEFMDVTAGETAPNREASLLEALEFYADPFAWKKKNDPQDLVRIPDFYCELDFGGAAKEALASFAQAVAETQRTESAESTPPAVFSDPTSQPPESGAR